MDIDVLFLQVSNFNLEETINNLCYLMDKREQMDKTTIVLSRMNYKYLRDKSNQKILYRNNFRLLRRNKSDTRREINFE